MARAGTLIGINYRLAVYQQTEADPLSLFGNNRLLSSKRLESRLFEELIRDAVPIPGPGFKSWRKYDPLSRVESKY
jgi:hypothetical protein